MRTLLATLVCSLALVACSDPADPAGTPDAGGPGADADASSDGPGAELPEPAPDAPAPLDLSSPGDLRYGLADVAADDLFAYPWPSDLRLNAAGAADLSDFPTDKALVDLLALAIAEVEAGSPGFSPLASAYFGFSSSVDPSTLPTDLASTLDPASPVQLVSIDPAAPDYGARYPISVQWREEAGGYWPARVLALHPSYQLPPRPGIRMAAILTRAVKGSGGSDLAPPAVVARLAEALALAEPPPEAEVLRPLFDALPDLGLSPEDLLAATVFTTADPMEEMFTLADWVRGLPAPTLESLTFVEHKPKFDVYEGTFTFYELFSGEPPFTDFGAGKILLDESGAPTVQAEVTLTFGLTVPRTPPPPGGFPLLLYGHGLGEDHTGFVRVAAAQMADRGVAVIGLDPPMQGARNPTNMKDRDLIVQLSVNNIVVGREILRQGVLDYVRLTELAQAADMVIPAETAPDGAPITFDPTRLAFMGHSEGAQIGALLLPLTPELGPAVFSEGGGGAAITMLALKLPTGLDVAALVAQGLGIDPEVEEFALGHPLVAMVIQPLLDSADPLHIARHIIREPLAGAPHDLLMLEGFLDVLTPPASMEALASTLGLPIAEPVARPIEGLDLQGVAPTPLPASLNIEGTTTGALLQLPEDDHYIVYFNEPVRTQLFDFLASALDGSPTIAPAAVR